MCMFTKFPKFHMCRGKRSLHSRESEAEATHLMVAFCLKFDFVELCTAVLERQRQADL